MNHKHDYLLDVKDIFTDDGVPQPRSQIFLECMEMPCPHTLRGNDIVEYIQRLEAKPDIRDLAEWMKTVSSGHRWVAEALLNNSPRAAKSHAQGLVEFQHETAAWIVCAADGDSEKALVELEKEVAKWKNDKTDFPGLP